METTKKINAAYRFQEESDDWHNAALFSYSIGSNEFSDINRKYELKFLATGNYLMKIEVRSANYQKKFIGKFSKKLYFEVTD